MAIADPELADAASVANALLGAPVDAIERVRGPGRNSRIYRVRSGADCVALKQYPTARDDPRDRLATETAALDLMVRHGIRVVPRMIASDRDRGYGLLSWVEGELVGAAGDEDIDAAAAFVAMVHELRGVPEAAAQPLGAEACLSGAEIVAQLGRRLARLGAIAADEPELADLLDRLGRFLFTAALPRAAAGYEEIGASFALPLPAEAHTLCPSDFGFHNALRSSGGLTFIDFEYFGWDDPVKLTSDFLLHPGMQLSESQRRRFAVAMGRVFAADGKFAPRLSLLYPLFAVRWCLILLNEFLPGRWATRLHAGAELDWRQAKQRQLQRAEQMLQSVETAGGEFPYAS
jgi:hypothetical protein